MGNDMNRHQGMCDASCAVPLSAMRFLVADDELNSLSVYDAQVSSPALQVIDLHAVADARAEEMDLEGAAVVADRAYWISSHGRNAKGKKEAARHSFFASTVSDRDGTVRILPFGTPFTGLLEAILDEPQHKGLGLHSAARRAPKEEGGLNIEGLAPARDEGLLIGFRSPLVDGRALVVHLMNPGQMIEGSAARFGPPRFADLGGLGIRSMELWIERDIELIVAGPVQGRGTFRLHAFDAAGASRVFPIAEGFAAEAVITFPGEGSRVLLLSDDGAIERSGMRAKKLPPDHADRYFRSQWVTL